MEICVGKLMRTLDIECKDVDKVVLDLFEYEYTIDSLVRHIKLQQSLINIIEEYIPEEVMSVLRQPDINLDEVKKNRIIVRCD